VRLDSMGLEDTGLAQMYTGLTELGRLGDEMYEANTVAWKVQRHSLGKTGLICLTAGDYISE